LSAQPPDLAREHTRRPSGCREQVAPRLGGGTIAEPGWPALPHAAEGRMLASRRPSCAAPGHLSSGRWRSATAPGRCFVSGRPTPPRRGRAARALAIPRGPGGIGEPPQVCARFRRSSCSERVWLDLTMAITRISEQRLSQARRPARRLSPWGAEGEWLGGPPRDTQLGPARPAPRVGGADLSGDALMLFRPTRPALGRRAAAAPGRRPRPGRPGEDLS
jgi:hypothetical protein